MPKFLWSRRFLENQGFIVQYVYVYQDNESAILLEENGIKSAGKASRYIKIKYFFVSDQIKGKELQVLYCPTEELVADFYTKPLQGSLFIKHRNTLLGIRSEDGSLYEKQYTDYINGLDKPEASV